MATLTCQVCISGGGPAGLMLGYLLARQGADVVVLEKHGDFLRDFRGDTIHPATLEIFHELGLAESLLALPHQRTERISTTIGSKTFAIADFTHLPVHHPFIAMMPQWDLLDFIADEGLLVFLARCGVHPGVIGHCPIPPTVHLHGKVFDTFA